MPLGHRASQLVSREGPGEPGLKEQPGDNFPDSFTGASEEQTQPLDLPREWMDGQWGFLSEEALCSFLVAPLVVAVAVGLLLVGGHLCGRFGTCFQISNVLSSV